MASLSVPLCISGYVPHDYILDSVAMLFTFQATWHMWLSAVRSHPRCWLMVILKGHVRHFQSCMVKTLSGHPHCFGTSLKITSSKLLDLRKAKRAVAAMVSRSKEGTDPEDSNLTEEEKTEKEQAELVLRS
ncbi:hypothetical protein RHMOL_Rhmol04G0012500 [Rhododendron molle]|uniref:Uncharacterized protein n=2 Tax=Rhododendron molle TaxID=49168 RepID=A0ACC0NWW7_RHOML|nr:hypothetical protein RHMOL_Rhmol04G0012500 [Rhododendron molle]KAI8557459.1 hypothetical protein RHMOL_Rhmol04G0012500 [Rhododendron molle]